VRCVVETSHRNIHDAIAEFQQETKIQVTNTRNVKVHDVEVMKLNTWTKKS